jgi:RimJ/RimL family protein N-acetyltransferase
MYRGAQRVELEVVNYNLRAIRCYEKCGFITEGKKRNRYFSQGKYHDTLIMGILRNEYDKLRLDAIN